MFASIPLEKKYFSSGVGDSRVILKYIESNGWFQIIDGDGNKGYVTRKTLEIEKLRAIVKTVHRPMYNKGMWSGFVLYLASARKIE